jgi:hypothetical protein
MSTIDESLNDLEQEADAKRRALAAALEQVRLALQPRALAEEAGENLKLAASDMLQRASEATNTKAAKGAGLAGLAMTALAAGWHLRRTIGARRPDEDITAQSEPEPAAALQQPADRNLQSTAATLALALSLGVAVAKFVPPTLAEERLLSSAGAELRAAFSRWAKRQTQRLIQPPADEPLRPANAVALAMALLLTSGKRREAEAKPPEEA